jgi:uncharacterized protein involved in exopolysaccharide biosynthesis
LEYKHGDIDKTGGSRMADSREATEDAGIDYLGVLLSRWKLVMLGAILCGVVALGVSFILPNEYEASSVLLVAPSRFETELRPRALSGQTYKRILESKGLIGQVLDKVKQQYPEDFKSSSVEVIASNCRVDTEITNGSSDGTESPLLILSVKHENPSHAKLIANIWSQEFIELNKRLQKNRTLETDNFVSRQFEEAKKKVILAEKAITDFRDTAGMESLKQKVRVISKASSDLLEKLEGDSDELAQEKQRLTALDERIAAVEVNGKWLCEVPEAEVDLTKLNTFQKRIASELLKVARVYQETTNKLASLAGTADVETLKKRLCSYRQMLVDKDPRLENIQAKRKSLEAALAALTSRLKETEKTITVKKSLPDDVLSERLLGNPSKKDLEKLSEFTFSAEELNPEYVQLIQQTIVLREELEKAMSEEKHITAKIPQLEEDVKKFESLLRIQEKKEADLRAYYAESKRMYECRYADYVSWLEERNLCRITMAELERVVVEERQRYDKRLAKFNEHSTELNRRLDEEEELKRELEVAKHAYSLLNEKVEEARIATAQETDDVRLVSAAIEPGLKVAPQRMLIGVFAVIIGFLLLSVAVVLLEYRAQFAGK